MCSNWPCPQILRPDWKGFPRTNPLAYSAGPSVMTDKMFYNTDPWCQCCSAFFFLTVTKLECLSTYNEPNTLAYSAGPSVTTDKKFIILSTSFPTTDSTSVVETFSPRHRKVSPVRSCDRGYTTFSTQCYVLYLASVPHGPGQGILTETEGSVQLTSSLR